MIRESQVRLYSQRGAEQPVFHCIIAHASIVLFIDVFRLCYPFSRVGWWAFSFHLLSQVGAVHRESCELQSTDWTLGL